MRSLINKDIQFLLGPIGGCRCEAMICFQRVFNFRETRWNIDKCVATQQLVQTRQFLPRNII